MPHGKSDKKKSFTDYQEDVRPGGLGNSLLKYVPDAHQVSAWVAGTLKNDGPNKKIDGAALKGKTRGQKK
tara:strand:+ start:6822 stop:7031 length:210 start_codon:yes stop_codon:yes gene_type:complete